MLKRKRNFEPNIINLKMKLKINFGMYWSNGILNEMANLIKNYKTIK